LKLLFMCFKPLSYYYSREIFADIEAKVIDAVKFQTPIVLLQSGNSLYLGKLSNYPKVSNNLTALFYGTFAKSSQTHGL